MRGVLAALILCNLVVAGWFGWRQAAQPERDKVVVPVQDFPQSLMLLAEVDRTAPATAGDTTVGVQTEIRLETPKIEQKAEGRLLCTLVGAFSELLQAEYFVEHLAALDVKASVEQVEVPGETSYWVYLPPAISGKEAMRQLHELQAKGFDTYIIPKGELADGISFGVFGQKSAADKLAEDMKSQGYPVEVTAMERTYQENWVLLQPQEAAKVDEELWLKLLSRSEKLEMRQNFCPGVANP